MYSKTYPRCGSVAVPMRIDYCDAGKVRLEKHFQNNPSHESDWPIQYELHVVSTAEDDKDFYKKFNLWQDLHCEKSEGEDDIANTTNAASQEKCPKHRAAPHCYQCHPTPQVPLFQKPGNGGQRPGSGSGSKPGSGHKTSSRNKSSSSSKPTGSMVSSGSKTGSGNKLSQSHRGHH